MHHDLRKQKLADLLIVIGYWGRILTTDFTEGTDKEEVPAECAEIVVAGRD